MKEQLITFETAKLAKEKGFNIPVTHYINNYGTSTSSKPTTFYPNGDGIDNIGGVVELNYNNKVDFFDLDTYGREFVEHGEIIYSAPTQSLLQKWLRETHDIFVLPKIVLNKRDNLYYVGCDIWVDNKTTYVEHDRLQLTFEDALEIGLQRGLKLTKTE